MTPLQFERLYQSDWDELETLLNGAFGRGKAKVGGPIRGDRIASLYRRACEHLAIARARSYPAYLLDRLDKLTADAHQLIYQRRELGIAALKQFVIADFPRSVRGHHLYVWAAAALLGLPTIVLGLLVFYRPELVLSVVDAQTAVSFEYMYSDATDAVGRTRDANDDWYMFGVYIRNNIGLAFQCFAAGLFFGIGSVFFLMYNGAFFGAVAGYVTERGLGPAFYSFVVTHGAFELTAIVLAGAAGLRLGHSLLAPGQRTRPQSLVHASKEVAVIVYGSAAMLLVAAAVEAFWSSASWLPHAVKYAVAAFCWIAVLGYLALQGRRAG